MRKVPTARAPGTPTKRDTDRLYDRTRRDRESTRFYHSKVWLDFKEIVLADEPYCRRCRALGLWEPARTVHHVEPLRERPDLALDQSNAEPLCLSCHARHEAQERGRQPA
jgi:5-methylcytosine-specific restriction enzyme A